MGSSKGDIQLSATTSLVCYPMSPILASTFAQPFLGSRHVRLHPDVLDRCLTCVSERLHLIFHRKTSATMRNPCWRQAFCSSARSYPESWPVCVDLGRRHSREAVVTRLREPAGPVFVVDLGGWLTPFLTALQQTRANDNLVFA